MKEWKLIRWMSLLLVLSLVFGGLIGLRGFTMAEGSTAGWHALPAEYLEGAAEKLMDTQWQLIQNGKVLAEDAFLKADEPFQLNLKIRVPVQGDKLPTGTPVIAKGETGKIKVFDGIEKSDPPHQGTLKTLDAPSLSVADWKLRGESNATVLDLDFNGADDVFSNRKNINLKLEGNLSLEEFKPIDGTEDKIIEILGKRFKVRPSKSSITKSGKLDKENRQIEWTVEFNGELKDHVFQDDLSEIGEYVENSFQVNGGDDSPTYDAVSKMLQYAFPSNVSGKQIIKFRTQLAEEDLFSAAYPLSKTNIANLLKGGNKISSDKAEVTFREYPWIRKKLVSSDITTGELVWEIVVNEDKYLLKDLAIRDMLAPDMEFVSAEYNFGNEATTPKDNINPQGDVYYFDVVNKEQLNLYIKTRLTDVGKKKTNITNEAVMEIGNIKNLKAKAHFTFWGPVDKTGNAFPTSSTQKGHMINWTIEVSKSKLNNYAGKVSGDYVIYDALFYDERIVNNKALEDLKVSVAELPHVDVVQMGMVRNPGWMARQKLEKSSIQAPGLSTKVYTIRDKDGKEVGDLLEISDPTKSVEKWHIEFQAEIRNDYVWKNVKPTETPYYSNALSLYEEKNLIGRNEAGIQILPARRLAKEMLLANNIQPFKDSPNAEDANAIVLDKEQGEKGFNYKTESAIFRISLNADNHQHLKDAMGSNMYLKEMLPEGWEFLPITDDKDYLIFKGEWDRAGYPDAQGKVDKNNPLNYKTSVKAIGGPVDLPYFGVQGDSSNKIAGKREVTFEITENLDGPYVLFLEAGPTRQSEYDPAGKTDQKEEATNKVSFGAPDHFIHAKNIEDQQTVKFDNRALHKEGTLSQDRGSVIWKVDYLPYKYIQTGAGYGEVVLQDTLKGMKLREKNGKPNLEEDDIVLYETTVDADGTVEIGNRQAILESDFTYDKENGVMKIKIPDPKKSYRLVYIADIDKNASEVSNEVIIVGKANDHKVVRKLKKGGSWESSATAEEIPEKIKLIVEKKWSGDQEADRPASVKVKVFKNSEKLQDVTLSTDNNWKTEIAELPSKDAEKNPINYSVEEETVTGYTVTIKRENKDKEVHFEITNTKTGAEEDKVSFTIKKAWNVTPPAQIPSQVEVKLLANGEEVGEYTVKLADNWTLNTPEFPVKDQSGTLIEYELKEKPVEGFQLVDIDKSSDGKQFTITNAPQNVVPTKLLVEKKWSGDTEDKRPASIRVKIYKNQTVLEEKTLSKTDNWKLEVNNLDAKDGEGNPIKYSVKEVAVNGYTVDVKEEATNHFVITNTFIAPPSGGGGGGGGGTPPPSNPDNDKPNKPDTEKPKDPPSGSTENPPSKPDTEKPKDPPSGSTENPPSKPDTEKPKDPPSGSTDNPPSNPPSDSGNNPPREPREPEDDVPIVVPSRPIIDIPNTNPPLNVPFVPSVIQNSERIPKEVERPIFTIINEDRVPLGNAVIDVPQAQYTFVADEGTPLGVAQIHNDNTLEILDEKVPTAPVLPKTGNADKTHWFYGMGLVSIALGLFLLKKRQ